MYHWDRQILIIAFLSSIVMAIVFKEGDPMDTGVTVEAARESASNIVNVVPRNKHSLFNERNSDVTFSVGATETAIPAHTFPLTHASVVFETLFSENQMNEPIRVSDFEAPTFCSLLRWIYCGELIFPPGMLVDVVRIAQKYAVHSLITFVTDNFEKVDKKYVMSIHTMAIELKMVDLAQKSLNITMSNQATLLESADFLNASCESVTAFVSLDRSFVTDFEIFRAMFEMVRERMRTTRTGNSAGESAAGHGAVHLSDFVRVDDGC